MLQLLDWIDRIASCVLHILFVLLFKVTPHIFVSIYELTDQKDYWLCSSGLLLVSSFLLSHGMLEQFLYYVAG